MRDCITLTCRVPRVARSHQVMAPAFRAAVQQELSAAVTVPVVAVTTPALERNHRRPSVDRAVRIASFVIEDFSVRSASRGGAGRREGPEHPAFCEIHAHPVSVLGEGGRE